MKRRDHLALAGAGLAIAASSVLGGTAWATGYPPNPPSVSPGGASQVPTTVAPQAPVAATPAPSHVTHASGLAFTGVDVAALTIGGVAAIGAGTFLVRFRRRHASQDA